MLRFLSYNILCALFIIQILRDKKFLRAEYIFVLSGNIYTQRIFGMLIMSQKTMMKVVKCSINFSGILAISSNSAEILSLRHIIFDFS